MRMIGDSPAIRRFRERVDTIARTPLPVLLIGETGTGKEVAAREIHDRSGRTGAFVPVDCAALSASLIESELFGHERGAFTGATRRREGLVWAARGGTFFLDEVAELPLETQTRLLRLLQEGTYRMVGSEEVVRADIRIVAATWRDLAEAVTEGSFRRDLYHRLAVVEFKLPPLRQRREDIDLLVDHFLEIESAAIGRKAPELDPMARAHLRKWPWPGNVRELRNAARFVAAMARGPRVSINDLPPQLMRAPPDLDDGAVIAPGLGPAIRIDLPYMEARRAWLDDFQLRYVTAQLEAHDGNVSAAARAAGMDRRSIQRILARARDQGLHDDE